MRRVGSAGFVPRDSGISNDPPSRRAELQKTTMLSLDPARQGPVYTRYTLQRLLVSPRRPAIPSNSALHGTPEPVRGHQRTTSRAYEAWG